MSLRFTSILLLVMGAALVGFARPLPFHPGQHRIVIHNSPERRAWLGVELEDVTSRLKERKNLSVERGAYVQDVVDESPAEKAGIEPGDVIVKFDGTTIDDSDDLMKAVKKAPPKTEVKVDVMRKAERKTLAVTLGRRNSAQSYSYNFSMPPMPSMPRMPSIPRGQFGFNTWSSDDLAGLEVERLSRQLSDYFEVPGGLLVTSVDHGSDADKAGFMAGDIITKVDGHAVRDVGDLTEGLADAKDSTASCVVMRKGKEMTLKMAVSRDDGDDNDEDDDATSGSLQMPHNMDGGWWHHGETLREHLTALKEHLRVDLRAFTRRLREQLSRL